MKPVHHAINRVYTVLKSNVNITMPVYKYGKPTSITPDEYIVIGALPITGGVLQRCRVNVRFYKRDIADGIPEVTRFENMSTLLMQLLGLNNDSDNGIYIDFENQEMVPLQETGEHFVNIRLDVKILNQ